MFLSIEHTPQDTLHHHPHLGPHVLPQGPVDGHIVSHRIHQLLGDDVQRLVAEHLHRIVEQGRKAERDYRPTVSL